MQVRPDAGPRRVQGARGLPKRTVEVTDGQVEAQLALLQERFASLQPVEDRPVSAATSC